MYFLTINDSVEELPSLILIKDIQGLFFFLHTKIFIYIFFEMMLSRFSGRIKKIPLKFNLSSKSFYRSYGTIIPFKLTDIGEGIKEVEILKMHAIEGKPIKQFENVNLIFMIYFKNLLIFF